MFRGVYIDKDKTFKKLKEYIDIVTNSDLINYKIDKFQKITIPDLKLKHISFP